MRGLRAIRVVLGVLVAGALGLSSAAWAGAAGTAHPVVFAHGMGGFNNILGFDYWGDDYGAFVGDPCDKFLEIGCNTHLNDTQQAFIAEVPAFESSEVRGLDLADDIEGFLATTSAEAVSIIGHSQGGIDARKAARLLYERHGRAVILVLITVSSPHRGSPVPRYILDGGPGATDVLDTLATYFGDTVYKDGNDGYAGALQLVHGDYDPDDGKVTGMKAFNAAYPADPRYVARYTSVVTAQEGLNVNPALFLLNQFLFDIDGDGYCDLDCGPDGIAGSGDGVTNETDDDGVVGINSQQLGLRLDYEERLFGFDRITPSPELGSVDDLEAPTLEQATSTAHVVPQDHLDVIGVGPDTFDEMEFYAALIDSIARFDRRGRISILERAHTALEQNPVPVPKRPWDVRRWLNP